MLAVQKRVLVRRFRLLCSLGRATLVAIQQPPAPQRTQSRCAQQVNMDLAVILPLAVLMFLQSLVSVLLLCPRALSKHIAGLVSSTRTHQVASTVTYTVAAAVSAMAISSLIQLAGVMQSMRTQQFGDRMLALTVEELRALLATVLGVANLALIFLNRALAFEQQQHDKAQLNLDVLRKQAKGLSVEYMRATNSKGGEDPYADLKSTISSLKEQKQQVEDQLAKAKQEVKSAQQNADAVKAQAKGLEREYDRLLAEHDALQRKVAQGGGLGAGGFVAGGKKAD